MRYAMKSSGAEEEKLAKVYVLPYISQSLGDPSLDLV